MRTPLPGIKTRLRAGVAAGTAVMAVFGLSSYAVTAGAAPQPSVSEAQAEVNQDNSQYDQANQQYDRAVQQAKQAQQKLAAINKQVAANEVQFTNCGPPPRRSRRRATRAVTRRQSPACSPRTTRTPS